MLKNYLLITAKVLLRRKAFTLINLLGICLTLIIVIVASTIFDNYINPTGPEKNSKNYLVIERILLTNKDKTHAWASSPGYRFLTDNVSRLKTPEKISYYTELLKTATYKNGIKKSHYLRRTDSNYWKILDFKFLKGRAFDLGEVKSGQFLAVINKETKKNIFGTEAALNQFITINNQRFKIIGIVENPMIIEPNAYADIWTPYTTLPSNNYKQRLMGGWNAILYHSNHNLLEEMDKEYQHLLKNDFISADPDRYQLASSNAYGKLEIVARQLFGNDDNSNNPLARLTLYISLLVFLFMLLPSINMINLNVSRIIERASEIGVRKAFGAPASQLVTQFIIENIILTVIGGILSIILSLGILQLIEHSQLIPYADFTFNIRVMSWSFLMMLLLGILSGLYPAIKMSRLNPVAALKGGV